jgi:chitinase
VTSAGSVVRQIVMQFTLVCVGLLLPRLGAAGGEAGAATRAEPARIVAYVTSWSPPVVIDTRHITHVNFAFAAIDGTGRITLPAGAAATRLREIVAVRRAHPTLRVLASVGGWGAEGFSDAALDESSRARFAASVVALLREYDLDGIDLDWEYPGQDVAGIKARPEDRENFTRLLAEVRGHLDAASRRLGGEPYLLTIATADREYFDHVEMDRLHAYVDWINVMAYDFYNSLTRTTGHHAGLHRAASAPATDRWGEASIAQHLAAGVPARKLVLGVAFYGRRFEDVAPANDGLNQPYARYGGEHSYRELVEQYVGRNGYARHWDARAGAPWLWNSATRTFLTYDDPESIRLKARFARSLGGVMFWELSQDGSDAALLEAVAAGLADGGEASRDLSTR